MENTKKIAIIGAGPAGLFTALQLLTKGYNVELFEHMPNIGRKFLVADHGGLNLTHSEDIKSFTNRYYKNEDRFQKYLDAFSPADYIKWLNDLGVETFVGSSKRVFPKDLSAAKILKIIKEKLNSFDKFSLSFKSKLTAINNDGSFTINDTDLHTHFDNIILALGGGSWSKTGSDAKWLPLIKNLGVEVQDLTSMNCGFEYSWSEYLLRKFESLPLKNIALSFNEQTIRGEALITQYGIEGSCIYALSSYLQEAFDKKDKTVLSIDFKPDLTLEKVIQKLEKRNKKDSSVNHIRKSLGLNKDIAALLREKLSSEDMNNTQRLSETIKDFKITLSKARPLEEAISSRGGIKFSELNDDLSLKKAPTIVCIGEMLDWEAPTGGYLLQGCFSTAYFACMSL